MFEPSPDDLRVLVLDYLCHNSFASTARAFVRDSAIQHLDADGDEIMSPSGAVVNLPDILEERFAGSDIREEIRIRILSGLVDEATDLLNKHFPSVLSESTTNVPTLKSTDRLEYIPATSVNPSHLALNLHILAFIEAARTIPLPYYPPGMKPPPAPEVDSDAEMTPSEHSEAANDLLLHRAQSLYSEANRLPDANDRALYLSELAQVGGLLAYPVPEGTPMATYMTPERREAIADQIESAILYRTGQPVIARLELAARQTSVTWSILNEQKVKPPPPSAWPAGLTPPGFSKMPHSVLNKGSNGEATSGGMKKAGSDNDTAEVLGPFDLHAFLDTPP